MDHSISILRVVVWYFFIFIQILIEHSVTISGDPDQMPFSAVSDLALHCLPMPHKKDTRLIWVNKLQNSFHSAYFSYIRVQY